MTLEERGFSLERIDGVLTLRDLSDSSLQPLSVDFSSPQLLHRLKTSGKNQPLAKAIGMKDQAPYVIDATAGLGTDALVLASLGCRVRSIERNETIFALLQDGHVRLQATEPDLASRMTFENADAKTILKSISDLAAAEGAALGMAPVAEVGNLRPDVIYLDPMYPDEGKSKALPKKTMQMFRRLLDGDEDAEELWSAAMKAALKRVVVKRPMHAPSLGGTRKPNHSFEGKTARYDLYLTV
jgi:16S rRNA (guanine1516-N2)-methyltransferase